MQEAIDPAKTTQPPSPARHDQVRMTRLMGRAWGCTGIMGIPRRKRMAINEQYTVMANSFGEKNPPPVIYSAGA